MYMCCVLSFGVGSVFMYSFLVRSKPKNITMHVPRHIHGRTIKWNQSFLFSCFHFSSLLPYFDTHLGKCFLHNNIPPTTRPCGARRQPVTRRKRGQWNITVIVIIVIRVVAVAFIVGRAGGVVSSFVSDFVWLYRFKLLCVRKFVVRLNRVTC